MASLFYGEQLILQNFSWKIAWSVTSAIGASARMAADDHRVVFYSITPTIPAASG